jgi:phage tail sheath protein FI
MSSLYKSPGVHIESAADRYVALDAVETGVTAFLGVTAQGPRNEPTRIGSYEQYEKIFGEGDGYMEASVRGFFENGGRTAYILNVAPRAGLDPTPDDFIGQQGVVPRGLQALEHVDHVDLIVAPDLMQHFKRSVGFPERSNVLAVQRAMIDHCEKMHDRFCLLDSMPGDGMQEAIEWRRNFDTSHASFYFPWIKVRRAEEVLAPMPPSGHIAGSIARADQAEGVHRAPANQPIQGLVDVSVRVRKRERDVCFDHRINTLIAFPGRGIRVWGARTLSSDPAWVQINVRRLFILIRKSVVKYAQWVVFEPNEQSLWKKIVRSVEAFLDDLWTQGALLGGTRDEAFYVKCDEETNPEENRDVGQLVVEIGVAPVKPAEFIVVRIQQWTRERTDADKEPPPPQEAAAT